MTSWSLPLREAAASLLIGRDYAATLKAICEAKAKSSQKSLKRAQIVLANVCGGQTSGARAFPHRR